MTTRRFLARSASGQPTRDGAGVRLTRLIGTPACDYIDPFLMLDRIDSEDADDYIAGFPDHPYRGFETVTIMHAGRMRHRDSVGNSGVIGPGDVQWMTAARGIIHSETPEIEAGRLAGFQLWINLPARLKMASPGYQEIAARNIPTVQTPGARIRVIAGAFDNPAGAGSVTRGPAVSQTPLRLLDIALDPGAPFSVVPPTGSNVFVAVHTGAITADDSAGHARNLQAPVIAVFEGDGPLSLAAADEGAGLIYGDGMPLGESVARHGPFVMNTQAELEQAVHDFQAGRLAT